MFFMMMLDFGIDVAHTQPATATHRTYATQNNTSRRRRRRHRKRLHINFINANASAYGNNFILNIFSLIPKPRPCDRPLLARRILSLSMALWCMRGKSIFIDRNICVCVCVKMRVVLVRRRSLCACQFIQESFNSNSSTYTPNAQDEKILSHTHTHTNDDTRASFEKTRARAIPRNILCSQFIAGRSFVGNTLVKRARVQNK